MDVTLVTRLRELKVTTENMCRRIELEIHASRPLEEFTVVRQLNIYFILFQASDFASAVILAGMVMEYPEVNAWSNSIQQLLMYTANNQVPYEVTELVAWIEAYFASIIERLNQNIVILQREI